MTPEIPTAASVSARTAKTPSRTAEKRRCTSDKENLCCIVVISDTGTALSRFATSFRRGPTRLDGLEAALTIRYISESGQQKYNPYLGRPAKPNSFISPTTPTTLCQLGEDPVGPVLIFLPIGFSPWKKCSARRRLMITGGREVLAISASLNTRP